MIRIFYSWVFVLFFASAVGGCVGHKSMSSEMLVNGAVIGGVLSGTERGVVRGAAIGALGGLVLDTMQLGTDEFGYRGSEDWNGWANLDEFYLSRRSSRGGRGSGKKEESFGWFWRCVGF